MLNIRIKTVFILALSFYYNQSIAQSAGRSDLRLVEIEKLIYQGDQLYVRYILPCHSEKIGWLLQTKKPVLRIGVLAKFKNIQCMRMPSIIVEPLNGVNIAQFAKVNAIGPHEIRDPLKIRQPLDVRSWQTKDGVTLQSVYFDSCQKFTGILISQTFAFVDQVKKNSTPCPSKQKIVTIDFLQRPLEQWRPATDLQNAFSLGLASIGKTGVSKTSKGGLAVRYFRHCQDVPVGIMLRPSESGEYVSFGLVVARFFNRPCQASRPKYSMETYAVNRLPISAQIGQIKRIAATRSMGRLRLISPTLLTATPKLSGADLKVEFVGGCFQEVGAIISESSSGEPLLGILQKVTDQPCNRPAKKISLRLPYFMPELGKTKILPMKLDQAITF